MKIICIGRNYAKHAKELGNAIPKEPLIFMKPPTALLKNNKPFFYPSFSKDIHFETEIILKIVRNGRSVEPRFAHLYYEEIGLGIDFTARDIQKKCKEKGWPWEKAKAFDFSAVIGQFRDKNDLDINKGINFHLLKNGIKVQEGNTRDLLFSFDHLLAEISKYFKLQVGDYIFTGTPEGVGPVAIGDTLEGFLEGEKVLHCEIK